MKTNKWIVLLFLLLITESSFIIAPKESCIEIKDRKQLPFEIYTILKEYNAILLGEIHGTNEAPEFAEAMVNLWLHSGEKVLVGLEIEQDNQSKIDSFLLTGNIDIIKRSLFFNREFKDGRSSIAMANLLKAFYQKDRIKIICFDMASSGKNREARDSLMALNCLNALKANKGWKLITLSGNIHNKIEDGYTMGYWLYNLPTSILEKRNIASIDIVFKEGSCWSGIGSQRTGSDVKDLYSKCSYENFFAINYIYPEPMFLYTQTATPSPPLNK